MSDPPAPGWWQAPDGGWHPPMDSPDAPAEVAGPEARARFDVSPQAIAGRGAAHERKTRRIGCLVLFLVALVISNLVAFCSERMDEDQRERNRTFIDENSP